MFVLTRPPARSPSPACFTGTAATSRGQCRTSFSGRCNGCPPGRYMTRLLFVPQSVPILCLCSNHNRSHIVRSFIMTASEMLNLVILTPRQVKSVDLSASARFVLVRSIDFSEDSIFNTAKLCQSLHPCILFPCRWRES